MAKDICLGLFLDVLAHLKAFFCALGPFGGIFSLLGPYIDGKFWKYHSLHFYVFVEPESVSHWTPCKFQKMADWMP